MDNDDEHDQLEDDQLHQHHTGEFEAEGGAEEDYGEPITDESRRGSGGKKGRPLEAAATTEENRPSKRLTVGVRAGTDVRLSLSKKLVTRKTLTPE